MTISYAKFFQPLLLTVADQTVYTVPAVPAGVTLRNARVRLTNFTTADTTAQLFAVPSAGASSTTNTFFYNVTVPHNDYVDVDVPVLAAGDSIHALAGTATSVNIQAMSGGLFS